MEKLKKIRPSRFRWVTYVSLWLAMLVLLSGCGQTVSKTPHEQVQAAVKTVCQRTEIPLLACYRQVTEGFEKGLTADIGIHVNPDLAKGLSGGLDFTWLHDIGLSTEAVAANDSVTIKSSVSLNDTEPMPSTVIVDLDAMQVYLSMPFLGNKTFRMPFTWTGNIPMPTIGAGVSPSASDVQKAISGLMTAVLESISNVDYVSEQKDTYAMEACGIVQPDCTGFKADLDCDTLQAGVMAALDSLRHSGSDNASAPADSRHVSTAKAVEAADAPVSPQPPDLLLHLYVGKDGRLAGLDVEPMGLEEPTVTLRCPRSGKRTAIALSITAKGQTLEITGDGTQTGGALSGKYQISIKEAVSDSAGVTGLPCIAAKSVLVEDGGSELTVSFMDVLPPEAVYPALQENALFATHAEHASIRLKWRKGSSIKPGIPDGDVLTVDPLNPWAAMREAGLDTETLDGFLRWLQKAGMPKVQADRLKGLVLQDAAASTAGTASTAEPSATEPDIKTREVLAKATGWDAGDLRLRTLMSGLAEMGAVDVAVAYTYEDIDGNDALCIITTGGIKSYRLHLAEDGSILDAAGIG